MYSFLLKGSRAISYPGEAEQQDNPCGQAADGGAYRGRNGGPYFVDITGQKKIKEPAGAEREAGQHTDPGSQPEGLNDSSHFKSTLFFKVIR
jgi:hypothetical protein